MESKGPTPGYFVVAQMGLQNTEAKPTRLHLNLNGWLEYETR